MTSSTTSSSPVVVDAAEQNGTATVESAIGKLASEEAQPSPLDTLRESAAWQQLEPQLKAWIAQLQPYTTTAADALKTAIEEQIQGMSRPRHK